MLLIASSHVVGQWFMLSLQEPRGLKIKRAHHSRPKAKTKTESDIREDAVRKYLAGIGVTWPEYQRIHRRQRAYMG